MRSLKLFSITLILFFLSLNVSGQISPGELAEPHAHLEGISNCTKCHELGEHVSDEKCLTCHLELKSRIDLKKGFHSSSKVYKKSCWICHSEHLSRKYDIVHLNKDKFDHQQTGWALEGKHKEKRCEDCHKKEHITDPVILKKRMTFLGLNTACLTCHENKHQNTLSANCLECHTYEAFKPASKFDHAKAKFMLKGKHNSVECKKCHEIQLVNGKEFQKFTGIQFKGCVNCHKDKHDNKFGQNCAECHSEESFKTIKSTGNFDHSKTDFKLEDKHINLNCKLCHTGSLTTPMLHNKCTDCHADYHKGQFSKNGTLSDCKDCHSTKGFQGSSFSIERHNKGSFKIQGAHAATPCISCHKKDKDWQFSPLDERCIACHDNIHKSYMDEKYIPEGRCDNCHNTFSWNKITFDHKITTFELKGKHEELSCRNCHFKKGNEDNTVQVFAELKGNCQNCHTDVHQNQFNVNGGVDCTVCHRGFENWKAEGFDHNSTRFKLEGGHQGVECKKCHVENKSVPVPFIQYKNTEMQCTSCHL